MKDNRKALLFAIATVLLWSTVGSAFKLTLGYLNYAQTLLYASLTSCVVLFILLVANNRIKNLRHPGYGSIARSALMGFINPFAYYLILLKAYSILQAQEAVALNYIWPMILVLLSVPVLKQKITWISVAALLISFTGTLVIATGGRLGTLDFSNPLGVGLALSSAFFWAVYWLLNLRDKREETEKLFLNFMFGFAYTLLFVLATDDFVLPGLKGGIGAAYIGLFEMGVAFVLWLKALKYAENTARVSNLVYLSPFLSLILVSFLVGEKIMLSTIAGLSLIIGGILLQHFTKKLFGKTRKSNVAADGL
jgi:drug/metabolite transporter (DMT)-like permease